MAEVSLARDQFIELSDQVGGSLVQIAASLADLTSFVRDLRDAHYSGRASTFGSGKPPGKLEHRWCPTCEQSFSVPANLPQSSREHCSFSCMAQAQAEKRRAETVYRPDITA